MATSNPTRISARCAAARRGRRILVTSLLASLCAFPTGASLAVVNDPLEGDYAASLSSAAPEATSYQSGDWGVADENGAVTYAIPVSAPPGRSGMQPGLSLSYSSRGGLRGGIAAGWSLELPSIQRTTESGGTLGAADVYLASFGGRTARLVEVSDVAFHGGRTFRMELDDGFARFELAAEPVRGDVQVLDHTVEEPSIHGYRLDWCQYYSSCGQPAADRFCAARFGAGSSATSYKKANDIGLQTPTIALGGPDLQAEMANTCNLGHCDGFARITCELPSYGWVVHTPDGQVHYLGTTPTSTDGFSEWRLDRRVDASGNAIDYEWREVRDAAGRIVDRALERVSYGANQDAGVENHAEIDLEYAPAPDICDDEVESVVRSEYEYSTNRGGKDYAHFDVAPDPAACRDACLGDARCEAWTYVKPGIQGSSAVCWLKSSVPSASSNTCCTSGVKTRETARVQDDLPIGARASHRSGELRYEGSLRLDAVVSRVKDAPGTGFRDVQRLDLAYDEEAMRCDGEQAPLRLLTRVERTAFAPDASETALPPLSFDYAEWDPEPSQTSVQAMSPVQHGTDEALEGTLLQIDGDGIPDRVRVAADTVEQNGGGCQLMWQSGLPGGGFDAEERSTYLPGLPWADLEAPGSKEGCSLMGQVTRFSNQDEDACPSGSYLGSGTLVNYRFVDVDGDGDDDLVSAIHADPGYYVFPYSDTTPTPYVDDNGLDRGGVCDLYGLVPESCFANPEPGLPQTHRVDCPGEPRVAEKINNQYAWTVWENDGGRFVPMSSPRVPFALAPVGNEGNQLGRLSYAFGTQAVVDMDGDGRVDLVHAPDGSQPTWRVYPGDGSGGWLRDGSYVPWTLPVRLGNVLPSLSQSDPFQTGGRRSWGTMGLGDVNGDGLPDLIAQSGDWCEIGGQSQRCGLEVYANNGHGFDSLPRRLGAAIPGSLFQSINSGPFRRYEHYRVDVDGDGLEDVIDVSSSPPVYYPNAGAHFLSPPRVLPTIYSLAQRQVRVTTELDVTTPATYEWEIWNDFSDMTGDGIADLVGWSGDYASILSPLPDGAQPHRLVEIDTGTGARVHFRYASVNDPAVVTRTEARDATRDLPHKLWVVEEVSVDDLLQPDDVSPTSITTYRYEDPVYASETGDVSDPPRFLGFGQVTRTTPLGATVERRYRFAEMGDARARLAREVTSADGSAVSVHEVDPWVQEPLFGGLVTFSHKSAERTYTCVPGDTPESCSDQREDLLERSYVWQPQEHEGQTVLFLSSRQEEFGYTGGALDERATLTWYNVDYDGDYRVLEAAREVQVPGGAPAPGAFATVGNRVRASRTETYYDDRGQPNADRRWIEGNTFAETYRGYDDVGNVTSVARPEQSNVKGGLRATTSYGPNRVFPAHSTNELGHVVDTVYDAGTGTLLERSGPNPDQLERIEIDGLGRTLERWVAAGKDAASADLLLMARTRYVDLPSPGVPRSVFVEERVDLEGASWRTRETRFDARDRVISVHDPVTYTAYTYDEEANLSSVDMADPSADASGSRVIAGYERDALGRLTRFTRPDQSGVTLTHEGLRSVVAEDGGTERVEEQDVFGRLIEVEEIGGASGPALTSYFYDGLGNVSEIVDADGHRTFLDHDGLGRRVAIERAGRVWSYAYDLDGNLVAETSPVPAGGSLADYTTTTTYDVIDRPTLRVPATRGLSRARQAELGVGPVEYVYDGDTYNRTGRLTKVVLPFGWVTYSYDPRGQVTFEKRRITVPGPVPVQMTRWLVQHPNALGQPSYLREGPHILSYGYDVRGLVESVAWYDPVARRSFSVARFERSPAGQVRRRTTDFGQERSFFYDALGRPAADLVRGPTGTLAWRAYGYTLAGDLAQVKGATGVASADASFAYDGLHRVVAADGPGAYSAAFTYSAAGSVETADVALPGSPLDRQASYEYGGVDPQAVTRLHDGRGGLYAFAYDLAGNMVERTSPEGAWELAWDGEDQLREVLDDEGRREIYYYDHEGQRVAAASDEGVRLWFFGNEYRFDADGNQVKSIFHVSAGGPALARVEDATQLELQYADSRQSLMLSVDAAGETQGAFLYGAFGEVVDQVGGEERRRHFNGKEHDAISGLRYYGARYYDPVTLQWNGADPKYRFAPDLAWNEPQRMNLYAFSLNNPLRYYDPDGREPFEKTSAIMEWTNSHTEGKATLGDAFLFVAKATVASPAIAVVAAYEQLEHELELYYGIELTKNVTPKAKAKTGRFFAANDKIDDGKPRASRVLVTPHEKAPSHPIKPPCASSCQMPKPKPKSELTELPEPNETRDESYIAVTPPYAPEIAGAHYLGQPSPTDPDVIRVY